MKEWVINSYSGYKGLVLQSCELQNAGPGEVRLRIEAFALNWGDADLMLDNYSFSFNHFPARIGMEACGIVDQIGPNVHGIEIGERYCTLPYFYFNNGTSAESAIVDARYITKAPEGLSAVESASIWMQFLTAYFPLIDYIKAGQGKHVLVPAATSTAGNAALQIGKILGANMISTTRNLNKKQYLLNSGANHVIIDDGKNDLTKMIMEYTDGQGFDLAFDPIGKGMMNRYSKAIRQNGVIALYGWLDQERPTVPILDMIVKNASFRPYSLFNYVENEALCEKGKAFVYEKISTGELKPHIDKIYTLYGYKDAWDYLRNPRQTNGKVVVKI